MGLFSRVYGHTKPERIYLDYAAATPVRPEIVRVMEPYLSHEFGNPSAIHTEGVRARKVIEDARKRLARMLTIRKEDLIFTGGGTESNHLALIGHVEALRKAGRSYETMHLVTTEIEHPSVLEVAKTLEERGVRVTYLGVDAEGLLAVEVLRAALTKDTVLVSVAYVNSEIGVVQDVKRLTRAVRTYEREEGKKIVVHLDASQAPLWLPCQMDMLGVDLMTLDAGKCYGPKGVGVLGMRHGVPLRGVQRGGSQESEYRAGTENTAAIIGCVEALMRAQEGYGERSARVALLRDTMLSALLHAISGSIVNGPTQARVPNNVNISIPGIDTEFAVIVLDSKGIAASTKSACAGGDSGRSHVVFSLTKDSERAASTLRFSLGEETTRDHINYAVKILQEHVGKMRTFTHKDVEQ